MMLTINREITKVWVFGKDEQGRFPVYFDYTKTEDDDAAPLFFAGIDLTLVELSESDEVLWDTILRKLGAQGYLPTLDELKQAVAAIRKHYKTLEK